MNLQILGMGIAVPPHAISQRDAATIVIQQAINGRSEHQHKFIEEVYLHAGVERRHSVILSSDDGPLEQRQAFFPLSTHSADLGPTTAQRMRVYAEAAPVLALSAASEALKDAGMPAKEITHIVTASCTGFYSPGIDLEFIERLQLPASTARTHIGFMGCHAAINALRVAHAYAADPTTRVLLTCIELCSLHHQYGWSPEQVVANALFADGAAAVVCKGDTKVKGNWSLRATASAVIPDTSGDMSWRIGDHGFQMTLSKRLPDTIGSQLRPWLIGWLASQELSIGDIGAWAIHPGGPKIISACEDALELSPAACAPSRKILASYGNMSSATVLFVIEELRRAQAALPCVALAFGPGLSIEAALFV